MKCAKNQPANKTSHMLSCNSQPVQAKKEDVNVEVAEGVSAVGLEGFDDETVTEQGE